MRDWLEDDDGYLARVAGVPVRKWRRIRLELIAKGLLLPEVRPLEGPVLRFLHPEHILAFTNLLEDK